MNGHVTRQFNPFPGLRPFGIEEDYLFFGREEQTNELLGLLRQHRFLAVVGTSGSGKSSLVRAGLLPALHGGAMVKAGSVWEVILLRPGGEPLQNLARALLDADLYDAEDEESLPRLKATLTRSRLGLVEAVKQSHVAPGTNLLVVVDQFEELFRFRDTSLAGQESATAFVKLLLNAAQQQDQQIYVTITMRSDYLGDCSQIPGLAEAVNDGEYLIPRLNRDQRRAAIEKPVSVGGGKIATRLVHKLLNEVGDDADQLPVLQHALMRIWDCWAADHADDEPLELRHYEQVGGMQAALSLHADEVYGELPDDRHREIARKLFQAITERGQDNRGIRRPTRVDHLCTIVDAEESELISVIDAFRRSGRTFLMPMQDVELGPHSVIDISHESLMRVWRRLSGWVDEESRSARIYRRLADTAALHAEGKAGVYFDPDLQVALSWRDTAHPTEAWAQRYHPGFEQAMEFLRISGAAKHAAEEAREAARQHELDQAKKLAEAQRLRAQEQERSAGRLRRLVSALAVAGLFALAACIAALVAFRHASLQGEVAQRARDSAMAQRDATYEALDRAITAEAAAKDATGAAVAARDEAEIRAYTASLAASAADLKRNDSRTLRRRLELAPERFRGWEWKYLWNESDRSLQSPLVLPPVASGYQMNLSRDGTLVAARPQGGHEKPVKIYDTRSGSELATLETTSSNGPLMTFSNDKRLLAYAHWGTPGVQIYEIQTGSTRVPETLQRSYNSFLGFDPSGERAVVLGSDQTLRVFKIEDWSEIAVLPGKCALGDSGYRRQGAISPDATLLVVGANEKEPMRVFNLSTNELVKEIPEPTTALAVRFDEDGQSVTTVASDGMISRYTVADWKKVLEIREGRQYRGDLAVYRLDGRPQILSFDPNGAVAIFGSGSTRTATLRGHGVPGTSIAVDAELDQIVTTHTDGAVRRWDVEYPRDLVLRTQHIAFTSDGSVARVGMSSSGSSGTMQVGEVNVASGGILGYLRWYPATLMHSSTATDLAYSPDGRRLAVATTSGWGWGRWRIYDLWTGIADFEELPWSGDLQCIDWSADGKWIAVAGDQYDEKAGRIRVYDAQSHKQLAQMDGHVGTVNDLAFSHDCQLLVTVADDGTLRTWEMPSGKPLNKLGVEGGPSLECLTFAPDGSYVVAGAADGSVSMWNPRDGKEKFRSQFHGASVTCLAFQPDGSRLTTAATDRSLKTWDPASWRELLTLHLEESVRAMAFSPDGKQLAVATSSLTFLDSESEAKQFEERRNDREARKKAKPLVENVLKTTTDPLQARQQLLADPNLGAVPRETALRHLRSVLDRRWQAAYQQKELLELVAPHYARYVLGEQLAVKSRQRLSVDKLIEQLRGLPTLDAMQRQALAEFVSAYANAGSTDGNAMAWEIAIDPQRDLADYALANFGIDPVVRQSPKDGGLLNTFALVQYRVGLFRESLTSAERSEELSKTTSGSIPHNVAIIAMSYHRMGQAEQAKLAMQQLDKLMQEPQWSREPEALALRNEAKETLDKPLSEPWDEQAGWDVFKAQLAKLKLDANKHAMFLTNTSKLLTTRNLPQQAEAWRKDAIELFRQLVKANPESSVTHRRLGVALSILGDHDEAIQELQRAVQLQPVDPNELVALADGFQRAGQLDKAESTLEQALKIDSKHLSSLINLGSLQRKLGKLNESRDTLQRAVELNKDSQRAASELQETEQALTSPAEKQTTK